MHLVVLYTMILAGAKRINGVIHKRIFLYIDQQLLMDKMRFFRLLVMLGILVTAFMLDFRLLQKIWGLGQQIIQVIMERQEQSPKEQTIQKN